MKPLFWFIVFVHILSTCDTSNLYVLLNFDEILCFQTDLTSDILTQSRNHTYIFTLNISFLPIDYEIFKLKTRPIFQRTQFEYWRFGSREYYCSLKSKLLIISH